MIELLKDLVGFLSGRQFRFYDWTSIQYAIRIEKRVCHSPQSLHELWGKVLSNQIKVGDLIEFRRRSELSWYLQEWVPRSPGSLWLQDNLLRIKDKELFKGLISRDSKWAFYHPHMHWESEYYNGKKTIFEQGFSLNTGIARFSLNEKDSNNYAIMSIVSNKEFFIDLSFPVIVSKEVYNKYIKECILGSSVEFEGILECGEWDITNFQKSWFGREGYDASKRFDILMSEVNSPCNLKGKLLSPLNMDIKINRTHPIGTIRVDGLNTKHSTLSTGMFAVSRYVIIDPSKDLAREFSDDSFLLGHDVQFDTTLIPCNDFDARKRYYDCILQSNLNPFESFFENKFSRFVKP